MGTEANVSLAYLDYIPEETHEDIGLAATFDLLSQLSVADFGERFRSWHVLALLFGLLGGDVVGLSLELLDVLRVKLGLFSSVDDQVEVPFGGEILAFQGFPGSCVDLALHLPTVVQVYGCDDGLVVATSTFELVTPVHVCLGCRKSKTVDLGSFLLEGCRERWVDILDPASWESE